MALTDLVPQPPLTLISAACGASGDEAELRLTSNTVLLKLSVESCFVMLPSIWVAQPEAASKLHVSERTLIRWRSSKFLKPGKHWRRALPSPRSRVLYNVVECEKEIIKACSREDASLEQCIKSSG